MIEESPKTKLPPLENLQLLPRRAFPVLRPRQLRAIEIAEGALLADIGVIFQLLIKFLPVGGVVLQVLVPVLFAVIVLRRGLYVGCMSLGVALFVVCIVMGPGGAPFLVLESGAGLFLGLVMRYRLSHFLTFVFGVLGGGLALWLVLLFYVFVGGGASLLLRNMHQTYVAGTNFLGLVAGWIGLAGFWQHGLFPLIDAFMQWGFQHWLLLYYIVACTFCIPLVAVVYFVVNFFLRLLGYEVRPFPGYLVEGWLLALASGILGLVPRRALSRFPVLYHLKREIRRLNMMRLRHYRLAKEGKGV